MPISGRLSGSDIVRMRDKGDYAASPVRNRGMAERAQTGGATACLHALISYAEESRPSRCYKIVKGVYR